MEGLRVLGKPERFAKFYYENGADELIYMDVVASLYGRNSLLDMIQKTSKEIFIPLTVGGGLRTLDDIRSVLKAGADKVSINTAGIRNPEFIKQASKAFGSSTILVAIEAMKNPDGSYEAYTDNGREKTCFDVFEWALQAAELGAGEIMITSIDREGTGKGFDIDLTRKVSEAVDIPIIAHGGAGKISHIHEVIVNGIANAVSIASIIHYNVIRNYDFDDSFSSEGNTEFLKSRRNFLRVQDSSLLAIKEYLEKHEIECRFPRGGPAYV
jgi:cyclase